MKCAAYGVAPCFETYTCNILFNNKQIQQNNYIVIDRGRMCAITPVHATEIGSTAKKRKVEA
eukprot:6485741-Heterocapsa_arctica.AAC.1